MRFLNMAINAVQVERDASDCLALADALAGWRELPGNREHVRALPAAFAGFAVLAAVDTNQDADTPFAAWKAKTRRVHGAVDTTAFGTPRLTERATG